MPENMLIISESGIATREDVALLNSAGIRGFLVGESFMRHNHPGEKLAALFY
ncbi:MAG: hypothetical protein ACWIPH_05525 [Ostreibacterium sp.]